MDLKNHIAECRREAGMSQQRLADEIGATLSMVGKLERGERELTKTWVEKIAAALNCDPVSLLYKPDQLIHAGHIIEASICLGVDDEIISEIEGLSVIPFDKMTIAPEIRSRLRYFVADVNLGITLPIGAKAVFRIEDMEINTVPEKRLAIFLMPDATGRLGQAIKGGLPGLYHIHLASGQILTDETISLTLPILRIDLP